VPPSIHKNKNRYHRAAGNLAFHHRDTESRGWRSAVHAYSAFRKTFVSKLPVLFLRYIDYNILLRTCARLSFGDHELHPKSEAASMLTRNFKNISRRIEWDQSQNSWRREIVSGFVEKYNSVGTSASYETPRASVSSAREISRVDFHARGDARWERDLAARARSREERSVKERSGRVRMFTCR
jgi:hypothetical protein